MRPKNFFRFFIIQFESWPVSLKLGPSLCRDLTVSLSGVKNADENELRSIASDPDAIHMYNVNDFKFLLDIVDDLTVNLCNSVKGPGITDRPASL